MRAISEARPSIGGRTITVPVSLTVEESAIDAVPDVVREVGLSGLKLVVVSGPGPSRIWGDRVAERLGGPPARHHVCANHRRDVIDLDVYCAQHSVQGLIAVGGGRVIDVCKAAAGHRGIPVLVVPTALSSDCIASPVAVIREGQVSRSNPGQMPLGVIIDLNLVRESPRRLLLSGLGDLLANLSASLDWQLAVQAGEDRWDGFADILARQAAEQVLFLPPGRLLESDGLIRLAEGLVMSGIAMEIAGSSRPCSGAEHMVSHALDELRLGSGTHGEQVALGLLYVDALRRLAGLATVPEEAIEAIRSSGLPRSPSAIGVSRSDFLRALRIAPDTRAGRYTVMDQIDAPDRLAEAYAQAFETG